MKIKFISMKRFASLFILLPFFALSLSASEVLVLSVPKSENSKLNAAFSRSVSEVYELRVQNIEIFNDALKSLKALENQKGAELPVLRLSLFDDVSFDIKISSLKTNSLGVFCVRGSLEGGKNSYAVLAVSSSGVLTAKIFDASKNYEYKIVCDVLNSEQKAVENDVSKMPNLPCGTVQERVIGK